MAEVKIIGLQKAHGKTAVLRGVDIEIPDGQFVVLVGPSGCGKSTLLRVLAGLEEVTEGEIWIGPKMVNDLAAKDRDVAMVFQNYALYPHMSVADNMAFSLNLRKISKQAIQASVSRVSEILGLTELLGRFPRELSGGQRQRVAMGRAIVRSPQVFLFDEPLSNLDARLRVKMRTEIKELHQRLKTTTIYVTHDQVEAMTMANQIVVMRDGRVEQVGTPLDLYDRPVNQFVAGFMGSPEMNFLAAAGVDGGIRLASGLELPVTWVSAAEGAPAVFGIRPEHLQVVDDGGAGSISCTVAVVEPTGSETILIAECEGDRMTALMRDRVDVRAGQTIFLRPTAGAGHVFDGAGVRVGAA